MKYFRGIHQFFLNWGIDLRITYNKIQNQKWFKASKKKFISMGGTVDHSYPILLDFKRDAGIIKGHYFHQDLLVAQFININNPRRHIDIGSRLDGFVAHLASHRTIDVIDIRPLKPSIHKNINFKQLDIMTDVSSVGLTDSLSCLHTIEHFGLGRYGDQINPNGHFIGFNNMISLLDHGGMLYISFPINSLKTKTYFNAHRVFHYLDILSWKGVEQLKLLRFDMIDDAGDLNLDVDLYMVSLELEYGCGIYTFIKS
jgi:hypothetical protein